jgi:hypothetical protein
MKKFIIKIILLCFPLLLPVILFVIVDPFMIFMGNRGKMKKTDEYNITLNRDFQSTELYLNNNLNYNSFIFGNSRSFFYDIKTWEKYIDGECFHFNSSSESLFGIERKLDFLNKRGVEIKNTLIILDVSTLANTNNSRGHLFIKHPLISGDSYISFYSEMFKGFFPKPMFVHTFLFFSGTRYDFMSSYGIRENVWRLNLKNNQLSYFLYDSIIKKDSLEYYEPRKNIFYKRDTVQLFSEAKIGAEQKDLLMNIKSILLSQNSNFKIIINPLYDQVKINNSDLNYLYKLFGETNVFDFSGINKYTESIYNYYETSHYRPHVANLIMKTIYENKARTHNNVYKKQAEQ